MNQNSTDMSLNEYKARTRRGFTQRELDGALYYTIPSFEETGRFISAFMTRVGGVSTGCYESLNLSVSREHNVENKTANYKIAACCAGVDPASLVLVNYAHGAGIACVGKDNRGEGLSRPTTLPSCDALIVQEPGVTAMTLHADCVPVFVADPEKGIGASAHAGWKGTVAQLPAKIIRTFTEEFGSRPEDLLCAIGPHIRSCCFEVGTEVSDQFLEAFGPECVEAEPGSKPHVDLEAAILHQFRASGVLPENVTLAELCTSCEKDLFYSYRRDRGETGAMAAMMAILPDG